MQKESRELQCYPFRMNCLPEKFNQRAAKELNETPETRKIELQKLKDLLSADKSTADIKFEEDFLHAFLRHRKYNSLKAFKYLQKFIKFYKTYRILFQSIPDELLVSNPSSKCVSVLPRRCPDGSALVLIELGKWDPNELPFEDFKRIILLSFMQPTRCPMTQISGFKSIIDFNDAVKHISYCTPQNMSLFYNASFNCIPGRYKEVHCINKNAVLTIAWAILKYAISEKMRKRIFFHSSPEDLLNHFPSSIIPTQYGGSLSDYHDTDLTRMLNKGHGKCVPGGQTNYY